MRSANQGKEGHQRDENGGEHLKGSRAQPESLGACREPEREQGERKKNGKERVPRNDDAGPGKIETSKINVMVERVDRHVLIAQQGLRKEAFVDNSVGKAEEKDSRGGEAQAQGTFADDQQRKAVGQNQEEDHARIQERMRRRVAGGDLRQNRRGHQQGEQRFGARGHSVLRER